MHSIGEGLPGRQARNSAVYADHVSIRGVQLGLDTLVDRSRLLAASAATLRDAFVSAAPFPHLVVDGLFRPELLDLVAEEFDRLPAARWRRSYDGQHERTLRSLPGTRLGHAAELYFGVLHSSAFVEFVQQVTGVDALITDPHLCNGGFHESRRGGRFMIHTDFNKHAQTRLNNEMVLITYLNREWDPAWGGALELWSAEAGRCVRSIEPLFGRTVLMRHGANTFHGHPTPLQIPAGKARRSVAAYYYSHRPEQPAEAIRPTQYMQRSVPRLLRIAAREITPPLVWKAAKRLVGR